MTFDKFFAHMREGIVGLGGDEFDDYVDELLRWAPRTTSGGRRGGGDDSGISTLMVNFDERANRLSFVAVDLIRIREFSLELERSREYDGPSR